MNNLNSIISEIGVIETALNIGKYVDDSQIVSESIKFMPFPDANFEERTIQIAEQIKSLNKEKATFPIFSSSSLFLQPRTPFSLSQAMQSSQSLFSLPLHRA